MPDNWFTNFPTILRDNPYLRLDFSSLFTGDPDERTEDEKMTDTHPAIRQKKHDDIIMYYANLNFGRKASAHRRDKSEMKRNGGLVICTVEDESTPNREWEWVSNMLAHSNLHRMPAFKSKHGAQVGDRDIVWRNVLIPGMRRRISVAVAHAPHPRMGPEIREDFTQQVHKAIRAFRDDWLFFGDWNDPTDPCNLANRFPNGQWKGARIDKVFCSKNLVDRTKVRVIEQPQRKDGHPWLELTFKV